MKETFTVNPQQLGERKTSQTQSDAALEVPTHLLISCGESRDNKACRGGGKKIYVS